MCNPSISVHSLQLIETKDGSQTVLNTELGSTYHSRHGALAESEHVFIAEGFQKLPHDDMTVVRILEMGFGTGLNALLTLAHSKHVQPVIDYHALELYPIPEKIWANYKLSKSLQPLEQQFREFHSGKWEMSNTVSDRFGLTKHNVSLLDFSPEVKFDLVYFDAFEPETQPELWTEKVFSKLFSWMNPRGILTTYCCKGDVRRAMISAGFVVEKVPGPLGKREMICAKVPLLDGQVG